MRSEDLQPSHHQCHGASALSSPPCTDVTPDHTSSSVSSPPPQTTDASRTVPPSSALCACVSVTLTPPPHMSLSYIYKSLYCLHHILLDYWKEKAND